MNDVGGHAQLFGPRKHVAVGSRAKGSPTTSIAMSVLRARSRMGSIADSHSSRGALLNLLFEERFQLCTRHGQDRSVCLNINLTATLDSFQTLERNVLPFDFVSQKTLRSETCVVRALD